MRTITHIIDTKAVKKVIATLPDFWVVRELTERDYGIDLLVEIFVPGIKDKNNRDAYEASGAIFHIQIKGTETPIKVKSDGTISYSVKTKSLQYVEKFSVPFLLFRVDVSSTSAKIYYIWLQRYIRDVLELSVPTWRDGAPDDLVPLHIPIHNEVSSSFDRIQKLALRPKYFEELIEYREIFQSVDDRLSAMVVGSHTVSSDDFSELQNQVLRLSRFSVLLRGNDCCVDKDTIEGFKQHLVDVENALAAGTAIPKSQDHYNLDLLAKSIDGQSLAEAFVLEIEGLTVY